MNKAFKAFGAVILSTSLIVDPAWSAAVPQHVPSLFSGTVESQALSSAALWIRHTGATHPFHWTTSLLRQAGWQVIPRAKVRMGRLNPVSFIKRWRIVRGPQGRVLVYYPVRSFYTVTQGDFKVLEKINPWMNKNNQPDAAIALRQTSGREAALARAGASVTRDIGHPSTPDDLFTANAGMAFKKNGARYFIPSRFKYFVRQGEEARFEAAFERRGYRVIRDLFEPGELWEGEGDLLELDGILVGGWGFRSDVSAHEKVSGFIGLPLITLQLVNPHFYHLDTAFAVLPGKIMVYMPAFDDESQQKIRGLAAQTGRELILLSRANAYQFAANAISFERHVILPEVDDELVAELKAGNLEVERIPMNELYLGGGAAKCTVLNVPAVHVFEWPKMDLVASLRNLIRRVRQWDDYYEEKFSGRSHLNTPSQEFLGDVIHTLRDAAQIEHLPSSVVERLVEPARITETTMAWSRDRTVSSAGMRLTEGITDNQGPERVLGPGGVFLDDANPVKNFAWRIIHGAIGAGKGGLRAVRHLVREKVQALALEMEMKLVGLPLAGAKGGIDVNAAELTPDERARLTRGYVFAILEQNAAESPERVAFGIETDIPAPDINTSPDPKTHLNLMNIATDELLRWLVRHGRTTFSGVELPKQLWMIQDRELGYGSKIPFVDMVLRLHEEAVARGETSHLLTLLAAFTGKSEAKGGSLGRATSTGLGIIYAIIEVLGDIKGKTMAIEGLGNVGSGLAKSAIEHGVKVLSIKEYDAKTKKSFALLFPDGITATDLRALQQYQSEHEGSIYGFEKESAYAKVKLISEDAFYALNVDILSPSAKEGTITETRARQLNAKILAEGANGATTYEGDKILRERGIIAIPDVFANAGGVIVSYFEMKQNQMGVKWDEEEVNLRLRAAIHANYRALARIQAEKQVTLRQAAAIRFLRSALASGQTITTTSHESHPRKVVDGLRVNSVDEPAPTKARATLENAIRGGLALLGIVSLLGYGSGHMNIHWAVSGLVARILLGRKPTIPKETPGDPRFAMSA